MDTQLLST
jgi:hypothetical protein